MPFIEIQAYLITSVLRIVMGDLIEDVQETDLLLTPTSVLVFNSIDVHPVYRILIE